MNVGTEAPAIHQASRRKLAEIRVVGVGGGGSNAVNHMFLTPMRGVNIGYAVFNTDAAHLRTTAVPTQLALGERLTAGRGAGGNPAVGRAAAEESRENIRAMLTGADLVFIAAGMGGGTGTGGAPVVAEIARELGALSIGVVTTPFRFEGQRRASVARAGLRDLSRHADSVVVVPNDRLLDHTKEHLPAREAFRLADEILRLGVQSIAELVAVPGDIILDLDELRVMMRTDRWAALGTATGAGASGLMQATRAALGSSLFSGGIAQARSVVVNFRTRAQAGLPEVREATDLVRGTLPHGCNLMTALITDAAMSAGTQVTVIAVGVRSDEVKMVEGENPSPANVLLEIVDQLEATLATRQVTAPAPPPRDASAGHVAAARDLLNKGARIPLTRKAVVDRPQLLAVLDALRTSSQPPPPAAAVPDPAVTALLAELRKRIMAYDKAADERPLPAD
jgi:cell division protein FtsZ